MLNTFQTLSWTKVSVLAFVLLITPFNQTSGQKITVIKAGKLIDPTTSKVLENQMILIENEKVIDVQSNLKIPDSASIVDLSDKFVLPGLFDSHTHLATTTIEFFGNNYYISSLLYSNSYRALQGAANARAMLESGFTTVRDVGNDGNYVVTDLRRAISNGLVPGPSILNAGRIIAPFGGQFYLQPDRRDLGEPEYFFADTQQEMLKAIRENIHFGALVIKIVVDDQRYIYSEEDIRFIVKEAGKSGLKVAAHCWTDKGALNAARAGVASIEHGLEMSVETLEIAKKNNVVLVGTDFTQEAANAYNWPQLHDKFIERLKRAKQVGIKIAFGTDAIFDIKGHTRGTLSKSFIDSYVKVGYRPDEILKMMTINAAELLGVDGEKGVIKSGYAADIVATSNNPLEDINALKNISFVMKGGKVFKQ